MKIIRDVLLVVWWFILGIVSSFIGIGGGPIFVPSLIWGLRLEDPIARGTSLVSVLCTAVGGILNRKLGLKLKCGGILKRKLGLRSIGRGLKWKAFLDLRMLPYLGGFAAVGAFLEGPISVALGKGEKDWGFFADYKSYVQLFFSFVLIVIALLTIHKNWHAVKKILSWLGGV